MRVVDQLRGLVSRARRTFRPDEVEATCIDGYGGAVLCVGARVDNAYGSFISGPVYVTRVFPRSGLVELEFSDGVRDKAVASHLVLYDEKASEVATAASSSASSTARRRGSYERARLTRRRHTRHTR